MLVRESIEDVLVPKSQDEINDVLDRWSLEEKIDLIGSRISVDVLIPFFSSAGAKKEDLTELMLKDATEEELREIITEIVNDDDLELITQIIAEYGDEEKLKKIYKKFIDQTNHEELTEILNNMILQDPQLVTQNRGWY